MTRVTIQYAGDDLRIHIPHTIATPPQARSIMRQIALAVQKAEYIAEHTERRTVPKGATVGEAE